MEKVYNPEACFLMTLAQVLMQIWIEYCTRMMCILIYHLFMK